MLRSSAFPKRRAGTPRSNMRSISAYVRSLVSLLNVSKHASQWMWGVVDQATYGKRKNAHTMQRAVIPAQKNPVFAPQFHAVLLSI